MSSFKPTPSSIRVNVLWFISLTLSLTTVLVGIISLQWLREHQQYDNFHGSELKFAIFNLRAESLARWYVPQIFAVMPLALQAALVLFFVGVIDFLLALDQEVATPVITVAGLPFLFLLATTLLPAFQAYTLRFPFLLQVNNEVPVPIPFRSPQSNIIRRLSSFSKHFFFFSACIFAPFYLLFVALPSHANKAVKKMFIRRRVDIRDWAPFLKHVRYTWSKRLDFSPFHKYWIDSGGWTSSDVHWPYMRTQYASLLHECDESELIIDRRTRGTGVWDFSLWIPNVYDCTRGFRTILKRSTDYDQVCRVGHCGEDFSIRYFQSLRNYKSQFAVPLRPFIIRSKSRALEILLRFNGNPHKDDDNPLIWLKHKDDSVDFDIMHTLHIRALLSSMLQSYHTYDKPRNILSALTECQLNLIKPLLVNHPNIIFSGHLDDHPVFLNLFFKHKVVFIPDLSQQWTSLLQQFLLQTVTASGLFEYNNMWKRVKASKLKALDIVIWEIVDLQLLEDALSTMQLLAERLLDNAFKATEMRPFIPPPDFLAFTTCCYLLAWLNNGRDVPRGAPPEQAIELRDALNAYIDSLAQTSSNSNHGHRDQRIHRRLKHHFKIMAKRFGEVYPHQEIVENPIW